MKLYGTNQSPFDRKVRVVLGEKGIPYETENLSSASKTPELLALHPMGKIPILRDGDVVVPDSSVICAYLEKKYPSPALYPADPAELAKALFLEEYADTQINEVMRAIVFERFVKPNMLQPDAALGAQPPVGLPSLAGVRSGQNGYFSDLATPRFSVLRVEHSAGESRRWIAGLEK